MKIPYTKAHGAKNDFLLTWKEDVPPGDWAEMARAICERHTGVGADGWIVVVPRKGEADAEILLYNSDGSVAEISGNGTRCAAAFLICHGHTADTIQIRTGAGLKTLRLTRRANLTFELEMNMGKPIVLAERFSLPLASGSRDVVLLDVGNPQCAVPVADFNFDWRAMGAEIESHPHFPNRTNVSFLLPVDLHTIEVRFYERGAGETMSSGTGSTAAAAAALARGMVAPPVQVRTPAGPLEIRVQEDIYLNGPAQIISEGTFFL
jgi:diaminopimelate epimerase